VLVTDTWPPVVRLGDWGSALIWPAGDDVRALYADEGPTEDDETDGYRPPEAIFDTELLERVGMERAGAWRGVGYDLWSLGVLLLEISLGTRNVFIVDDRRWLRIQHNLKKNGVPASRLAQARQLQAMLDLCIAPRSTPRGASLGSFLHPSSADVELQAAAVASVAGLDSDDSAGPWCTDHEFEEALRHHDVAGIGIPSKAGRDLLRKLLQWSPEDRLSARDALAHSWFSDGAELPPLRARTVDRNGDEVVSSSGALGSSQQECESEEEEYSETVYPGLTRGRKVATGCPTLDLHVAAFDNIGRRRAMEDRHSIRNLSSSSSARTAAPFNAADAAFVGVFDGHSGDAVAERLRRSLHRHLAAEPDFPSSVGAALRGAFAAFDETQEETTEVPTGKSRPGSTALVGIISGCRLYLANLGDCRAVLAERPREDDRESQEKLWPLGARVEVKESPSSDLRGQRGTIVEVRSPQRKIYVVRLLRDGALRPLRQAQLRLLSSLMARRLTTDHKPDAPEERRRIEALGGEVTFATSTARVQGLATSRCFGSEAARPYVSPEPDIFEYLLEPTHHEFIVLASDGIWDVLADQLVVDLVWGQIQVHDSRRGPAAALEDAARAVVQAALESGSLDNLTCMVVHLSWGSVGSARSVNREDVPGDASEKVCGSIVDDDVDTDVCNEGSGAAPTGEIDIDNAEDGMDDDVRTAHH